MRNEPPHSLRFLVSKEVAFAVATLCIVVAVPFRLDAQQLILHTFVSPAPDQGVERLLYLAAGVELMREGFSSTREGSGESYILVTDYAAKHDTVNVRYTLLRPNAASLPLASVDRKLRIDQSLDAEVASTIVELLRKAKIAAVPSSRAEIKGLLPKAVGPAEAQTLMPRPSSRQPAQQPSLLAPAERPSTPEILPAGRTTPRGPSVVRFDSSFSAAGVLFFGQMTEYFHYGLAGQLTAGLVWPKESWSFGVGAKVSTIRAFNDYGVVGGPLYLSLAGLNLQAGTGTNRPYRVAAEFSGGAALVTVASPGKMLDQVAPYGDIGARAVVPLGGPFSLGAELRFLAIVDNGLLIMGVTPAITVSLRP